MYSGIGYPAWQGSITQAERNALERVQKCACYIILGNQYSSYKNALKSLNLETLESRRRKLSLKFAIKASKHSKFKAWFKPSEYNINTRQEKSKFCDVKSNHVRFEKSALSYLTKLLNEHHKKKWILNTESFLKRELLLLMCGLAQVDTLELIDVVKTQP